MALQRLHRLSNCKDACFLLDSSRLLVWSLFLSLLCSFIVATCMYLVESFAFLVTCSISCPRCLGLVCVPPSPSCPSLSRSLSHVHCVQFCFPSNVCLVCSSCVSMHLHFSVSVSYVPVMGLMTSKCSWFLVYPQFRVPV